MKRLVYSPSIKVWVKSDSGVIDLSPYVTECMISRKIDDVSKAEIQFRNPRIRRDDGKVGFMFTQQPYTDPKGNASMRPVFHPMDPITIVLERIQGKPIQVFTGYCDTTPYVQLFPGTARISASCTLKRLNFTFWDPALSFVADFLTEYGWIVNKQTGQSQNQSQATAAEQTEDEPIASVKLNDSSIAKLLYATLSEIGGWDDKNIFIQPLPKNLASIVAKLFDEFSQDNKDANKEIGKLIKDIIGAGQFGSGITGTINANVENADVTLPPGDVSGTVVFDGVRIAGWIEPILKYARTQGWTGAINDGFRTRAEQEQLYARYVNSGYDNQYLAARPGESNHEGAEFPRGAVDVEDYYKLNEILLNSQYKNTLRWYGEGDKVHFSHTGN